MDGFMRALVSVWTDSGFAALTWENVVMILVGLVLLYLAIAKEYEPLLLLPIAFGADGVCIHSLTECTEFIVVVHTILSSATILAYREALVQFFCSI